MVVLIAALQVLLHSGVVTNLVNKYASEYVDGELGYSSLDISLFKSFPNIRVTIDSLSLTYPHDRFARYDGKGLRDARLDAGRGAESDTLAAFDHFTVAVNPWKLLSGRIRVSDLHLDKLALYAHDFGDEANWMMFKTGDSRKDTTKSGLPLISVGTVRIAEGPRVVYTNQVDTLFADLGFRNFEAGGDFLLDPDKFSIRGAELSLDSLKVNGSVPAGTVSLDLDYLDVKESLFHIFDLRLGADASASAPAFGTIRVPLALDGKLGFKHTPESDSFNVPGMDVRAAHIPLHLAGDATMYGDSTRVDASVDIAKCPLDTLLREYVSLFVPSINEIATDATLDLGVEAEGWLTKTSLPDIKARVKIPGGHVTYIPYDIKAGLRLDAEASMKGRKKVDATLRELVATTDGFGIEAAASARDVLGADPAYKLDLSGSACLDSLVNILPESLGVADASGRVDLDFKVNARQSELSSFEFADGDIHGTLTGDRLFVSLPKDTLETRAYHPYSTVSSDKDGLLLTADMDSVYFEMGKRLTARIRDMRNRASIVKVETRGQQTTRLSAESDNNRLFVKVGSNRIMARKATLSASAQRRVRPAVQRPARPAADTARRRMTFSTENLPEFLREADFRKGDVHLSLDSTVTNYLREWSPMSRLVVSEAGFVSPLMPLRTRLSGVDLTITDNNVRIDSLKVRSGRSDLSATGSVSGMRGILMGRMGVIRANLDVKSRRINVNELVAAFQRGVKDDEAVAPEDENDESFVVDTIDDAQIDSTGTPLIIVPANLVSSVSLRAGEVDFKDIVVDTLNAMLKTQGRTLQLTETNLRSNYGNIGLEAYYSTISKSNISAGADIHISDVSAYQLIHLLPAVDHMMPALKSFEGRLGCEVSATTQLDTNMNIVMPTLDGLIKISGEDLEVKDAGNLKKITRLLLFKDKNIGHIDNLYANAVVHDNKVEIFPFEIGVDRYRLALYGMQGFDRTMYYHASILKSPFLLRFGINIFGTLDNWRFTLGFPKYSSGKVPAFEQEVDNVQINIVQSIRNIFKTGVADVQRYNRQNIARLGQQTSEKGFKADEGAGELNMSDVASVDDIVIDNDFEEMDRELESEVDSILAESFKDTEKIMKDYADQVYNKSITSKIQKLKTQAEIRSAREAKKAARQQ